MSTGENEEKGKSGEWLAEPSWSRVDVIAKKTTTTKKTRMKTVCTKEEAQGAKTTTKRHEGGKGSGYVRARGA